MKKPARSVKRNSRPTALHVFWHVCTLNHWQDIATEQLRLFAHFHVPPVCTSLLGTQTDEQWLIAKAKQLNVDIDVSFRVNDVLLYEVPALHLIWKYAYKNPTDAVLYLHTKGASAPPTTELFQHKMQWRRLMQKEVLCKWKENWDHLYAKDVLGVAWRHGIFPGNFWMARCDWLRRLRDPWDFRATQPPTYDDRIHPWKRLCAERWLGSRRDPRIYSYLPGIHISSLATCNSDVSIPTFMYDADM